MDFPAGGGVFETETAYDKVRRYAEARRMKKLIGLIAFSVAAGMLLQFIACSRLTGLIMIGLLLLVGYHLFCGD